MMSSLYGSHFQIYNQLYGGVGGWVGVGVGGWGVGGWGVGGCGWVGVWVGGVHAHSTFCCKIKSCVVRFTSIHGFLNISKMIVMSWTQTCQVVGGDHDLSSHGW